MLVGLWTSLAAAEAAFFSIRVVDEQNGRGVPLVELRTVHNVRHYTDSAGFVAFHEPGLMDQEIFFFVTSHGYEYPADGFGFRGARLSVSPGGTATLKIRRLNIAERLYRVTGGGIYRDSVLLGQPVPIERPVLNGLVLGQDSVFTIVYAGRLYWFWGDTGRPGYPLGNFHMSGATSQLPKDGGLDPATGVNLTYFVDERGFSRGMAPMPGDGPTWADAFVTLRDEHGRERMYGAYAKIRPGSMEAYERGLMVFNNERQLFEKVAALPVDAPLRPAAHAAKLKVDGVEYVYFATPYPLTRVRATLSDYCKLAAYEAFTCLERRGCGNELEVERSEDGTARYGWKHGTPAVTPAEQDKLSKAGKLKPEEALLQLQDADSGKGVLAHAGSVYWNPYRQRWIMIVCEQFGTSLLGETWYAEADTPLGPWVYARKVVTHDKYSFYNPKQHPMFDQDNGRVIFFEATYTHTFSGNPDRTPRYDYNQIMYRLDLADPRLVLPVPVYRNVGPDGAVTWTTACGMDRARGNSELAFFALDRHRDGSVPVFAERAADGHVTLRVGRPPKPSETAAAEPVFYALPPPTEPRPATCAPLFEYVSDDGLRRDYSTDAAWSSTGFRRADAPVCIVWRNPIGAAIPWRDLRSRTVAE
jgi:hypothetical protein